MEIISGITYQQKIRSKNGTVWANCVCMNGRATVHSQLGFPGGSVVKNLPAMRENQGSIPGEGNGNPLQYSCPENPMDKGAWWATVHGVSKSWTQLSD